MHLFLSLLCFVACVSSQATPCTDFSYKDQAEWRRADCDDNFCAVGTTQSPIQVASKKEASGRLSQLRFKAYGDSNGTLEVDGETIVYTFSNEAEFRNLHTAEVVYSARYFEVHLPAEHILPGHADNKPDVEIQLYHVSVDGTWAVVSFFFKVTEEETPFWEFLDLAGSKFKDGAFRNNNTNITGLQDWLSELQSNHEDSYYYYSGSLTQPPCTELVHWHLIDSIHPINVKLYNAFRASISSLSEGNARAIQRTLHDVAYWNSEDNAVTDAVCGGGLPNWNQHPYDCTDQMDHAQCFYCSGRANGFEAKSVCLSRKGRECNELFSSPEAMSYCNLAFECPASTFSSPFILTILSVLLAVKNFW